MRRHARETCILFLLPRFAVLSLFQALTAVIGETAYYNFTVNYGYGRPDFVQKTVLMVNGQFPGPTIRVRTGNRLEIRVKNEMSTEGLTIHWHGISQKGTPWSDGAAYVTQCPIDPGETFTYNFLADQPGTFFYHGHYGLQRSAGLYGSLIVEPRTKDEEPFTYDEELVVILSDWYHLGIAEQQVGMEELNFRWIGNPQSLLINGRGRFDCSLLGNDAEAVVRGLHWTERLCNPSSVSPAILPVEHGKIYRLRVTSSTSLATLNFLLEGHNFTIVEVEGHYVEPIQENSLYLFSGQSYSVIFRADADPSRNYWAAVNMHERNSTTPTGLAILQYASIPPTHSPPSPPPGGPIWDDYKESFQQHTSYVSLKGTQERVPAVANRRLILLNTEGFNEDNQLVWALNNISYRFPETPALALYTYNFSEELSGSPYPADQYSDFPGHAFDIYDLPKNPNVQTGSRAYVFQRNDVVDIILQNSNSLIPGVSDVHPWHMHGQSFWVLGFGNGSFDPLTDYEGLNYNNPHRRNTVPLFPYGWTAIRFVADNPGVWNFHCHVEFHHHMGMQLIFAVDVNNMPDIPMEALGCGRTKVRAVHV